MAGLWERWKDDGAPQETCTLLATEANELLAPYHDRMPVILRPEDYDLWLDTGVRRVELLQPLLHPYPHGEMGASRWADSVQTHLSTGTNLALTINLARGSETQQKSSEANCCASNG